ncbi:MULTISPECIES: polysaccharide deacetylase family protein [Paraburkholderia]|uniref:Peptidoglycan/xylan/chitin deacetylase (PgdA/CDA1 family) n=1 Tax=Paraburkholderia youngii TaxID=2782701 RepID=A0A7W8LGQ1_9BURK|nr:polysaccharide deacetylase family protein [Paraburkholderia youngii]MBB5405461.1 peptidoglycan/xylan/chitin deacetylase (PgdA/CDA1 family) [Paraburkholderia youngii]NVI03568.1 polysaccharide deacetylase family protein [Paraburkholderia youngii]
MNCDTRVMTRWPGNATTVVAVTVHVDGPAIQAGEGVPPLGTHSRGRYAMRAGVWRYLEMLERLGVPATFFSCGHDVEHYPHVFTAIHRAGHEIAAHGYQHEAWAPGECEPALLEKTHRIITDLIGDPPVGWCSPSGRKSRLTIPVLRRLGYWYDASEKDFDLPYLLDGAEATDVRPGFMVLPNNTTSLDDFPLYTTGQALAPEVLENWIEEFEAIHQHEGYLQLTIHPKAGGGSGTPARARTVERFIEYMARHRGVRFMTLRDLAGHCLKHPDQWRSEK